MAKNILSLIMLLTIIISKLAAEEPAPAKDYSEIFPFGVGIMIAGKGGVNTLDPPDGIKNGFNVNNLPDFGAQVYIPFGGKSNVGGIIDLGYYTYSYKFKLYNNEGFNWVDKLNYFVIAPNFHLSGFLLGFNFGIPMGVSSEKSFYTFTTDQMSMMVDVHIGGLIPLYKDDFGRLNLLIQGEYALTKTFKSDIASINYANLNTQPASLKIGLTYIFNIK